MSKAKHIIALLLFVACFTVTAQVDLIKPLTGNSTLINHKQIKNSQAQKTTSTASFLPFYDDFSYFGPYPNSLKWDMSQSVFVNHTYPIAPPTIGCATFDGLTRFGYPYNIAATSGSFLSDTLLSVPLRLDYTDASQAVPITPADSVYLSFYYQLKGRGDRPEQNDALYLYFFGPNDSLDFNNGNLAWSHQGSNVSLQVSDTNFHRVMIPITDTSYFKNGFRFAFVNWGTQCGAIDHWHIDLVYLNKGRSVADTLFPDVSFVYDNQTLLKDYMQMPHNQFAGAADMKTEIAATLRNNKNTKSGSTWSGQVNISTEYKILDNTNLQVAISPTVGTNNFFNYDSIGYCQDVALIKPSLAGYAYNNGPFSTPTSFDTKFYVKNNSNDTVHANDTAYFHQDFNNYYSYDDGTAEGGYYVSAYGGHMAVKYKTNVTDTLRAIDIFFDPVIGVNQIQNASLGLIVWSDNGGGIPGTPLLYDSSSVLAATAFPYPQYSKNGYNVFQRYQLSQKVIIPGGTTFYVGTYQITNLQLGIGYDMNTDYHQNVYYFDGTSWNTSSYKGSLMIHPVFGDSLQSVNVNTITKENDKVSIYPNPATDEISIATSVSISKIIITDVLGNTLIEEKNSANKISVSTLPNGLYLLRTFNTKGSGSTQKLIISH